jgi:hypothetical protein
VPLLDNQTPANRGIDWLAVIRTLLLQGLVLLALAGAVVVYLRWSSDANWSEFVSESRSPLPDRGHRAQSLAPVQTVNGQPFCDRKSGTASIRLTRQ